MVRVTYMDLENFESRKRDHLRQALEPSHQAIGASGLDSVHLFHDALPELNFDEISLESTRLGQPAATPFFIAGMTAGHPDAVRINEALASACAARGWAMGVGSQRRELENDSVDHWENLRELAPGLTLYANLGISQLILATPTQVRSLVERTGAHALAIHLNALQETLQPEGTPQFRGALEAIRRTVTEIGVPLIVKETGCGFSERTLGKLRGLGVAAVDVSGLGGTHWGRIEGARAVSASDSVRAAASESFRNWGESTVDSVIAARRVFDGETWASGGVRTGLDAAKLIALGAQQVGYAKPALEAALQGPRALESWMDLQEYELKVALFCTGSRSPTELGSQREGKWIRKGI